MNSIKKLVFFSFVILVLSACGDGIDSPRGFSLPKGDIDIGKQVFIKHNCSACHSIEGINTEGIEKDIDNRILLGGKSPVITTYAKLVTSIINPSHRIYKSYEPYTTDEDGLSVMRNYNDIMTVSELIDVVAYLQPKYKVEPLHVTPYAHYYVH